MRPLRPLEQAAAARATRALRRDSEGSYARSVCPDHRRRGGDRHHGRRRERRRYYDDRDASDRRSRRARSAMSICHDRCNRRWHRRARLPDVGRALQRTGACLIVGGAEKEEAPGEQTIEKDTQSSATRGRAGVGLARRRADPAVVVAVMRRRIFTVKRSSEGSRSMTRSSFDSMPTHGA